MAEACERARCWCVTIDDFRAQGARVRMFMLRPGDVITFPCDTRRRKAVHEILAIDETGCITHREGKLDKKGRAIFPENSEVQSNWSARANAEVTLHRLAGGREDDK